MGHSDLVRLKEGEVDVQVFSVWMGQEYGNGRAYDRANNIIDSLLAKEIERVRAPLSLLIDHIDYMAKLVGVE